MYSKWSVFNIYRINNLINFFFTILRCFQYSGGKHEFKPLCRSEVGYKWLRSIKYRTKNALCCGMCVTLERQSYSTSNWGLILVIFSSFCSRKLSKTHPVPNILTSFWHWLLVDLIKRLEEGFLSTKISLLLTFVVWTILASTRIAIKLPYRWSRTLERRVSYVTYISHSSFMPHLSVNKGKSRMDSSFVGRVTLPL